MNEKNCSFCDKVMADKDWGDGLTTELNMENLQSLASVFKEGTHQILMWKRVYDRTCQA